MTNKSDYKLAKKENLKSANQSAIELPHLKNIGWDFNNKTSFKLNDALTISLVPPKSIFNKRKIEFAKLKNETASWLLISDDNANGISAQELTLSPSSKKNTVEFILRRNSGRKTVKGLAKIDAKKVTFTCNYLCAPKRSLSPDIIGELSANGSMKIKVKR